MGVWRAPGGRLLRPPVEVMLARPVDRLPAGKALPGGVQYEQKWDGYRVLAFRSDGVYLQSRRGANLTAAFVDLLRDAAPAVALRGLSASYQVVVASPERHWSG